MLRITSKEVLEKIAKESGFMVRSSKITPSIFLDSVFFDNLDNCASLRRHSIATALNHNTSVSKQAFDKRFNPSAVKFMKSIFDKVYNSNCNSHSVANKYKSVFSEIRIMDSTEFRIPASLSNHYPGYGGKGREAIAQLQFEYEITGKSITKLTLGNALLSDVSEGLKHLDKIPENSLLIRDLGYFNLNVYKQLEVKNIYYISRLKPQLKIYVNDADGIRLLTYKEIINKLNKTKKKYLDLKVYIGKEQMHQVRLIASKLTKEQRNRRLKRFRERKGVKLSELDKISSQLNLFVTNVTEEMCMPSEIYQLYKIRWQIELIFKVWKSILKIHSFHSMNHRRFECYMIGKLLWIMLNWRLLNLFNGNRENDFSYYKLTSTIRQEGVRLRVLLNYQKSLLKEWLIDIYVICNKFNLVEYKQGTEKLSELLKLVND